MGESVKGAGERRIFWGTGGFRYLLSMVFGFLILDLLLFLAIRVEPSLLDSLCLSRGTPWGIVTSVFVHSELDHLLNNIIGLITTAVLFGAVVYVYPPPFRRERCMMLAVVAFLAGVGANLIQYLFLLGENGFSSWGSSGMVYGGLGVLLVTALKSVPEQVERIRRRGFVLTKRQLVVDMLEKCLSAISLLLLAVLIVAIFFDMEGFFGSGPGINVFVHEMSFLLGLLLTSLSGIIR